MSESTIKCPSGHSNSAGQKFCGECGVSLVGVCPNGHPNPDGQRYCGECGEPLGQSDSASLSTSPSAGKVATGTPPPVTANRGPEPSGLSSSDLEVAGEIGKAPSAFATQAIPKTKHGRDAEAAQRTMKIGDKVRIAGGLDAVVVKFDVFNTVWLETFKGQTSYGISKYPLRDVEKALADQRVAGADGSTPASGAQPSPGSPGGIPSAQPPHSPPGPPQLNQTVTTNVFSVIAFVLAGLALFGGVTLVALPTIFGIAGIVCAVVAFTKKERLAPFAIGAAVGGLILGWLLQAAVFNTVFN